MNLEQLKIAKKVITNDSFTVLKYIAGLDIGFVKNSNKAAVGIVILEYPSLKEKYSNFLNVEMDLEYIPGFLAFREVPHYQKILKLVPPEYKPDLLMVDGNGILHARKCGVASHLGVLEDTPSIGVAKTLYNHDSIKNIEGYLVGKSGTVWGKALTEKSVNPIYVSIGHRISLETSTEIVKNCCIYRIPEPIRLADNGCRSFLNNLKNGKGK
jgi:deoxyinosine 3'endonuclease (endonuclease V)